MSNDRKHTEKTSADSKAIGFDYQYYFFLWKLLSLKTGESVGYEVKDDVHTELANDHQILYQIKHTVKLNSSGSPKNLTTSDSDLWHTLSNWVQVITDANDGRENKGEQLKFLEKTRNVSTCFEPVTQELNCISRARGNVGKFTPDSRVA